MKNVQKSVRIEELKFIYRNLSSESSQKRLANIDSTKLNPGLAMYYSFIQGELYMKIYRKSTEFKYLQMSVDYFDNVFVIGRKHSIAPRDPRYHTQRAGAYFIMSDRHPKESMRLKYTKRAIQIARKGLEKNPENGMYHVILNTLTPPQKSKEELQREREETEAFKRKIAKLNSLARVVIK